MTCSYRINRGWLPEHYCIQGENMFNLVQKCSAEPSEGDFVVTLNEHAHFCDIAKPALQSKKEQHYDRCIARIGCRGGTRKPHEDGVLKVHEANEKVPA